MSSFFIDYLKWHYTYGLLNIFRIAKEFIRFLLNLFSVTLFLKTLFIPIFSIPLNDNSNYIGDMIAEFVGGTLIRLIGAFFRLALIILGLFFSFLTFIISTFIFILWLLMPLISIILFYYGFTLSMKLL